MQNFNIICNIYICILILAALYFYTKRKNSVKISSLDKKTEYIILAGILLFGFFLRVYQFGNIPAGINQDGAMAAVDAKALADYGTDRLGMKYPVHFTAWGYGQMSVLLSYMMIPFIKVGGLSVVTARIPMVLASMAGILCVYLFVKDLTNSKKALVVAGFITINPWHIIQSRWALDCNLFPHVFVIGLFFLYRGIKNKDKSDWFKKDFPVYLSMFFFAMCMYCYGISFYTVPVFLLIMCVYMLVKKLISWKGTIISVIVYFFFSWPIYLVMVINTLKLHTINTPFFTIPYFENSVRSNDILFFSKEPLKQLASNIKSLWNIVVMQGRDLPWNSINGFGIIYLCSIPLVILGLIYGVAKIKESKDEKEKCGFIAVMTFLFIGILAGLITSDVNINRINIVIYPMIILTGLGICFVLRWGRQFKYAIILPYAVLFVIFITTYFSTYAEQMKYYFFSGFDNALYYAKEFDCDTYYITPDVQYEGSKNVSEVITLFCHDIDSRYFQGKTNEIDGETELYYSEKYQYTTPQDIDISPQNSAVYVINSKDTGYFNYEEYHIEYFDRYCTVVPLSIYGA